MTPLQTPSGDPLPLLAVVVPKDSYDCFIGFFSGGFCYRGGNNKPNQNIIYPPPGEWEVLGEVVDGVASFDWPTDDDSAEILTFNQVSPGAGEKVVILKKL